MDPKFVTSVLKNAEIDISLDPIQVFRFFGYSSTPSPIRGRNRNFSNTIELGIDFYIIEPVDYDFLGIFDFSCT